jgi:hypothetical protein
MAVEHIEHQNHIASGLSTIVERLDQIVGNSTWRSTATNATTLKELMRVQSLACHETDRSAFQTAMRKVDEYARMGMITDSQIASMNDLATSRAVFESQDSTLTSHKFGGTR